MKKVRLADIAVAGGVSIQHVSRALTGNGRIDPKTRERLLALAERMGYLNPPRKNYIAVLSPSDFDDWNILCLEVLRELGMNGVLIPFREFTVDDEKYFDAAIYANGVDHLEQVWFTNFHIPLLAINQYGSRSERIECVQPDADGEMRLAVEHLASLGHKKIARLHPTPFSGLKQNIKRGEAGFFQTADKMGILDFVRNVNYESADKIKIFLPQLLKEGFTAFIIVADPDHRRLLEIFRKCGKRIPEDVSIIVYEIDLPPELELTSIEIDNHRVVETGMRLLLEKLEGHPIPLQTIVPGNLHIRQSTGRVPS